MTSYKIDGFQMYEYSSTNPKTVIFFAHANGIPALSYAPLWQKIANALDVRIISYDMRGFGGTAAQPVYSERTWGWKVLVQDHVSLFERIKKTHPKNTNFILCGHSSGAWLSLLSTEFVGAYPLVLVEPPILPSSTAFQWYIMRLLGKHANNPRSQKVLKRRTSFDSLQHAFESLKNTSFLSEWSNEALDGYIKGSFSENKNTHQLKLKHKPEWEAHIFSQYPPSAAHGFLKLSKKLRHELKPCFIVGSNSDSCNANAKSWVKLFFPSMEWKVIPNVGHMFPIEYPELLLDALKEHCSPAQNSASLQVALETP